MKKGFLVLWAIFFSLATVKAQYWFGPKVGVQRTDHVYQDATYKSDSFNVKANYNFQVGAVLTYQASDRYSVHTELNFERYGKNLANREGTPEATSKSNSGFLTVPLAIRFNFGRAPYMFYLNGGTKLSYWLYSNGTLENAFLQEAENPTLDYRMVFGEETTGQFDELSLERPNRLQYALIVGGGVYFDMRNEARIMLDIRYSFGHSNMGFNGSTDFDFEDYIENFEYRHNALSVSVGYLFEYNAQLRRKGRSTNRESNKKR